MTFLRFIAALILVAVGIFVAFYGAQALVEFHNPLAGRYTLENSNFVVGIVFLLLGIGSVLQGVLMLLEIIAKFAPPQD